METLQATATLIDKSLLVRAEADDSSRTRYYALEAVRAYAFGELTSSGEIDDAMDGLIRHATREARLAADGLIGHDQAAWLERVRQDRETYRLVLSWLLHHGRAPEAAEIGWRLIFFFFIRGYVTEATRWYRQILAAPNLPLVAEAQALAGDASMRYSRGELPAARAALERILAMGEGLADPALLPFAELLRAHVLHAQGEPDAAREGFLRSIHGYRALNTAWAIGNGLSGLAASLMALGDDAGAAARVAEAEIVLQEAGPWFLALTRYVEAMLALRRHDADAALRQVRNSLTHIRAMQDKFTFVNALVALFLAAVLKGDDEWAARIQGAREAVTDRTGVSPSDQPVHEIRTEMEQAIQRRLGAERWGRAYAAGRSGSIDTLLGEIDQALAAD
jgi:tetratricopeptide (TPR) repeat protein